MPRPRPLRLAPEWDDRFGRMLGVSALGHVLVVAVIVVFAGRASMRPLPMTAYTVELTDPSALGGRVPPGPLGRDLSGGPQHAPVPEPKGEPAAPPAPPDVNPEPKPEPKAEAQPAPPKPVEPPKPEQQVQLPDTPKPPEAKPPPKIEPKPEPKPPPKPEPKPEPRAEPKPAPKPEPPKPAEAAKPPPKAPPAKPAETASSKPADGKPGSAAGKEDAPPRDAYAAAAERWRARGGGGLGGTDTGSGPIGAGGEGPGGGGQLVGLEFMAYRQQVINTIKAQWTNVIARPGLVAAVRFEIASDGQVGNVRLAQSSGNAAYDASAVRAVQHTSRLPAPPARYASEFREFVIEFHSEETGGQGAG